MNQVATVHIKRFEASIEINIEMINIKLNEEYPLPIHERLDNKSLFNENIEEVIDKTKKWKFNKVCLILLVCNSIISTLHIMANIHGLKLVIETKVTCNNSKVYLELYEKLRNLSIMDGVTGSMALGTVIFFWKQRVIITTCEWIVELLAIVFTSMSIKVLPILIYILTNLHFPDNREICTEYPNFVNNMWTINRIIYFGFELIPLYVILLFCYFG